MIPGLVPQPFVEIMSLVLRNTMMLAEAQAVIAMRLAGLAGFWHVTPHETSRMFTEKLRAARESSLAAARSAMAGDPPHRVADAALKPIRRRTRANAARLAKRGPRHPV